MGLITHKGDFKNTENFLKKASKLKVTDLLKKYGYKGAQELSQVTPFDSGLTAQSWNYLVESHSQGYRLVWTNDNVVDGVSVAILLQYGHGTKSGSYVEGRDYINPVMRPILDDLSQELWKEVTEI